jgi:glycosyltransferase involved in cell wall biosynthesis
MSESKYDDAKRHTLRELAKRIVVSLYDAALVGGSPQISYCRYLGVDRDRIFSGCDVVDNEYYRARAESVRRESASWHARLSLPSQPFFLAVSRFVEKKNLPRLVDAYSLYVSQATSTGDQAWGLVLCGDGPLASALRSQVKALGLEALVHFAGFRQSAELCAFYALAGGLILPSAHGEQWGLVVNEAMASGLPVLVSTAVGCSSDLVVDGRSGFLFDPLDVGSIARCMAGFAGLERPSREAMGRASAEVIEEWGPDRFAKGLLGALVAGGLPVGPLAPE